MPLILHIVYSGLGGTAGVALSLIEAEKNASVEHCIAFYGTENLLPAYAAKCESLSLRNASFLKKSRFDLQVNRALFRWIDQQNPDTIILHLTTPLPAVARFKRKKPSTLVIGVEHNSNELKRKIDWIRSAMLMRQCDKVVYLSQVYRQQVADTLKRFYRPEKSVVIPNGIDLDCFQPVSAAPQPTAQPTTQPTTRPTGQLTGQPTPSARSALTFGMCSRLVGDKDIDTLIDAFASLSRLDTAQEFTLSIAGDGPLRASLEDKCKHLGLSNVQFCGMLDLKALANWYRSLDVYVHATLAETMSLAVMQGMASGLPIIASDVHGMSELVPDTTGMLVAPRNAAQMTDAMTQLAQEPDKRAAMATAALSYARTHFSQDLSAERYRQLIDA